MGKKDSPVHRYKAEGNFGGPSFAGVPFQCTKLCYSTPNSMIMYEYKRCIKADGSNISSTEHGHYDTKAYLAAKKEYVKKYGNGTEFDMSKLGHLGKFLQK